MKAERQRKRKKIASLIRLSGGLALDLMQWINDRQNKEYNKLDEKELRLKLQAVFSE